MTTYSFAASVQHEDDGRWSAWISALPGCAAWGSSKSEALNALADAAQAYVADMLDADETVPRREISAAEGPLVTVKV